MNIRQSVLPAFICMVTSMSAQTPTDTTDCDHMLHLQEVVVTGLTGQTRINQLPAPILVIHPRQLQESSSTNIIDALSHQPGVSQITTGSGISKPVIRGLGYNRIVTVVDGIRQEGQQWGDEHGVEVDAQTVNSVEILKGPASLMYGSDAMAGVLVLNDAPLMADGRMAVNLGSEYQSNNKLFDYTVNFAGRQKSFVWNWRWSQKDAGEYKNKTDGRVPGSQFKERAVKGMMGIAKGWGHSLLKLSYYYLRPGMIEGERDAETNTLEPSDAFQRIQHYKALLDNSFYVGEGSLKVLVGYQQNRRQEFENTQTPGLDFKLHTMNYDIRYLLDNQDAWQVAGGISGMWQRSENMGTEFLIPAYRLFDIGIFASVTRHLERLTLSGGLRLDNRSLHSYALEDDGEERFTDFRRSFRGLTGSIGAIYNITERLNARLNISHGFRAPNLSELGSNGEHEGTFRFEHGNQNLKAEQSWQLDMGMDFSSEYVSLQLSLFANHISNYIYLQRESPQTNDYRFQQGTARLWGGEVSIDLHPFERLHFENTFSYVNARQLHQPEESRWLPFTPAPRWTSDLRYDVIRNGRTLNNTFVSMGLECYLKQANVRTVNNTETATPSYTLLSLTAGTDFRYRLRKVASLYVSVQNLANRAYQSHLSRLKYVDEQGICNMGRSFNVKLLVPIAL